MADLEKVMGVEVGDIEKIGEVTIVNRSTKTITVKTVDATTRFLKGDKLYSNAGSLVGTIEQITATTLELIDNNLYAKLNKLI